MKITLENIGKIRNADIEINGITVIAGANDTGKSTISKVLFSVFNSLSNIDNQIFDERVDNIKDLIDLMYHNVTDRLTKRLNSEQIAQDIIQHMNVYENDEKQLKIDVLKHIGNSNNFKNHEFIDETIQRILEVMKISKEDIADLILEKNLETEFHGQINNLFMDTVGIINLQIQDKQVTIKVDQNKVKKSGNIACLRTEAIYIDDPFIVDDSNYTMIQKKATQMNHREHLKYKLMKHDKDTNIIKEFLVNKKMAEIYNKISTVCEGALIHQNNTCFGYKKANSDKVLDAKNLSTGLKTFVILKMLLVNGTIEENGTIILDEPEIHLHPEWQLLFAELIVLLQKEFKMHILLNTHSPYFLNAIEVYSQKYGVDNVCKYYLASNVDDTSMVEDVSDNLEAIYSKLARPLQVLENERYLYD